MGDPDGFPRNLLFELRPFQVVQTPKSVLMLYMFEKRWRTIWTDGRQLPKDPDPRWYGYSVGRWEDDSTFVVNSVGMDERTWLDNAGSPHSDQMKVEERYHRVDQNTMELTVTIDDPEGVHGAVGASQQAAAAAAAARHRSHRDDPLGDRSGGIQESLRQVGRPVKWTPHLLSIARIVFGFLVVRHGMEQLFGYPEASAAARLSYEGIVELIAFPAGLLIILGLFTRPVGLLMAALYFVLFFVGPLQRGWYTHRNGGDPILLNAFFFLYLAAAGGGAWKLDRNESDTAWAPQALGLLRIVAGCLFVMHGLEKFFSVGGGRIDRDIMTMRGLAGWLEFVGGPLIIFGLFTRPVAFLLSGEMAVAYFRNWAPRGFWQSFQLAGMEASILFCFLYLFFWAAGPGAWSLDGLWATTP